ncbi:MAG: family 20 glycosylhydrolase [Phycisphaeraceae bacterium]|nr:family 20 glycosylhydrolase [Phycisphaeraceae bacterium]
MSSLHELLATPKPAVPLRGVHLDLKGVPPTFERLLALLKVIAAAGYNALLVEWEDMFPWTVDQRFRCETAYAPAQVQTFCARAKELGLEVVSLVQCLGHLETPLSLPEYAHLREVADKPDVMNPLAKGGRELIEKMVDDVLALTPGARYFHLGGDEAWTFGTHPDTKEFIAQHGKGALYLRHVEPLLDKLLAKGIRPILWHDMMVEWDETALKSLSAKADLMVWGYHGHPDTAESHYNTRHIKRFFECGVKMWGATAYKGGEGEDVDLPNLSVRQTNAQAWAEVGARFNFQGVVATAWSRYATHRVQNEPIDACLDALVGVGVILHEGRLPEGGFAAAVAALEGLGEKNRFEACKKAMAELTQVRNKGWYLIRRARQHAAMIRADARRDSGSSRQAFVELRDFVGSLSAIEATVYKAFTGLIDKLWIDRYLLERLEPLRQEWADVSAKARA